MATTIRRAIPKRKTLIDIRRRIGWDYKMDWETYRMCSHTVFGKNSMSTRFWCGHFTEANSSGRVALRKDLHVNESAQRLDHASGSSTSKTPARTTELKMSEEGGMDRKACVGCEKWCMAVCRVHSQGGAREGWKQGRPVRIR